MADSTTEKPTFERSGVKPVPFDQLPSAAEQRAKIAEQRRQNGDTRGRVTRGGRVLQRRYREYRDYSRDAERPAWYVDHGRGPQDGYKRGPHSGAGHPAKRGRRDPETVQRSLDQQLDAYLERNGSQDGAKAQQRTSRTQRMLSSLNPESITPEQLKKREERFAAFLKPEKDESAGTKEATAVVPPEIADEYKRAREGKCALTSPEALERRRQRFAQPAKPEEGKEEPAADAAAADGAAAAAATSASEAGGAGEEAAEAKSDEAAGEKKDEEEVAVAQEEEKEPELDAEDAPAADAAAEEAAEVELVGDEPANEPEGQQQQPVEAEEKQEEEEPAKAAVAKKKKAPAKKGVAKKVAAGKKGTKAAAAKKAKAAQGDGDDVMILP